MSVNSQTGTTLAGEPSLTKFPRFLQNFVMHCICQTGQAVSREIQLA